MLEKQRLNYLDSLGIDNYMPRRALPNALPSELLSNELLQEPTAFSTADMPAVEQLDPPVVKPISAVVEPQADAIIQAVQNPELNQEPVVESASISQDTSDVKTADKKVPSNSQPIRFSLNIWRLQQGLMVIDSRQTGEALPTDRLLQNILRSIGHHVAQLPASELLRWPLFKNQQCNNEAAEARAMVQAYIDAQHSKTPVETLLLLGKHATDFALAPANDQDIYEHYKGAVFPDSQWKNTVLIAPSLIDMLHHPEQKRLTWQALQTLLLRD